MLCWIVISSFDSWHRKTCCGFIYYVWCLWPEFEFRQRGKFLALLFFCRGSLIHYRTICRMKVVMVMWATINGDIASKRVLGQLQNKWVYFERYFPRVPRIGWRYCFPIFILTSCISFLCYCLQVLCTHQSRESMEGIPVFPFSLAGKELNKNVVVWIWNFTP